MNITLRQMRERARLTQRGLAYELDVSLATIQRYERDGVQAPTLYLLATWAVLQRHMNARVAPAIAPVKVEQP